MSQAYASYLQVPWYRRSSIVGAITFLGLVCSPAILFSCFIVLTGDVYSDKIDENGQLKKWSFGNKVAAVIILIIQVVFTVAMLSGAFSVAPR